MNIFKWIKIWLVLRNEIKALEPKDFQRILNYCNIGIDRCVNVSMSSDNQVRANIIMMIKMKKILEEKVPEKEDTFKFNLTRIQNFLRILTLLPKQLTMSVIKRQNDAIKQ